MDASYVDDCVFPVFADAKSICDRVQRATCICYDVFASHGMILNFAPGKTEALIHWNGADSVSCRREFSLRNEGVIRCPVGPNPPISLRVVHEYKHLGTTLGVAANVNHEIRIRNAVVRQDVPALRQNIFKNLALSQERKLQVAQLLGTTLSSKAKIS